MNWLTNYVLPKIRAFAKKDVPDNLWKKCPSCEQMLFHRELAANLEVCRRCGHHFRIGSEARFRMLFDDDGGGGSGYRKIALPAVAAIDPLRFRDTKRYADRLRDARAAAGAGSEAVALAEGEIGGHPAVVAAFDFAFMGGSMGIGVGEALVAGAQRAVERQAALIVVPASGGARMQEGILSLMQMPRTIIAAGMVKEARLPYIVILTDPTTGGVSASFAMLGDITLAEPGAIVGFAGARVIEETIREKLPEGFQRSEYLYEHGMVDQVVPRAELKTTLARVLALLREPRREASPDALSSGAGAVAA
jgi:acetyl-CoA carboxylase carboxyl transferase subunit beta